MPPEEAAPEAAPTDAEGISALRAEFERKFAELSAQQEEIIAAKDAEITQLSKQVTDLRAEVVSAAVVAKKEPEPEKTEAEVYQDEINLAAEVTFNLMKDMS